LSGVGRPRGLGRLPRRLDDARDATAEAEKAARDATAEAEEAARYAARKARPRK
jgi:hypothetical protein